MYTFSFLSPIINILTVFILHEHQAFLATLYHNNKNFTNINLFVINHQINRHINLQILFRPKDNREVITSRFCLEKIILLTLIL